MSISKTTRMSYSELNAFIEVLDEEDQDKVPQKFKDFIRKEMDQNYIKVIDPNIEIKDQNLKDETLGLIAIIYLKYLCDDEDEKQKLRKIYSENEISYCSKHNGNNFFNSKVLTIGNNTDKDLVKGNFKNNFIDKIKAIFANVFLKK